MMAFHKGNQASFEALMRKYYGRILNFIYRFVGNQATAEDLTQDVFVQIYKSKNYTPDAKFQTWAFTIAKNICLNELRRSGKRTFSLDAVLENGQEIPDSNAINPLAHLHREETQKLVQSAIMGLPENQRVAVILSRYESFSYNEIAIVLECSEQAVKSLLSRAKENLKVKLVNLLKKGL